MKKNRFDFSQISTRVEFEQLMEKAQLVYSLGQTKSLVWLPYGIEILNSFSNFLRETMKSYDFSEYIFPSITEYSNFEIIKDNIFDFEKKIFRLGEYILRPSGEVVIYPFFKEWVKSGKKLPLKVYQIGNLFRKSSSGGLFRGKEAPYFIEGHTAHLTREEATKQFLENDKIIEKYLNYFGLPIVKLVTPIWTNKPVAEEVHIFNVMLPNGEVCSAANNYSQMQIFSKIFKIETFVNGKKDFTYQTNFGFSSRLLFLSLWVSSDQYGLNILPSLAPYKVHILDMNFKNDEKIASKIKDVMNHLSMAGISYFFDNDYSKSVGKRRRTQELAGVPLRIEIGKDEIANKLIKIVRRYDFEEKFINCDNLVKEITIFLEDAEKAWHSRLLSNLNLRQSKAESIEDVQLCCKNNSLSLSVFPLCYSENCVREMEKRVGRGEVIGYTKNSDDHYGECLVCKKRTFYTSFYGRRF